MNEQIKKLHDQAFAETTDYYATMQRFAELIAKECAKVARWTDLEEVEGGDGAVLRAASEAIENHFGVK